MPCPFCKTSQCTLGTRIVELVNFMSPFEVDVDTNFWSSV